MIWATIWVLGSFWPASVWAILHSTGDCRRDRAVATVVREGSASQEVCTGTFVTPRVMIMAAHCTVGADRVRVGVQFGRVRRHPRYRGEDSARYDIAVVEFPAGYQHPFTTISSTRAPIGGRVRLVGFGESLRSVVEGADGRCRSGYNRVSNAELGQYVVDSSESERGTERALHAEGDSGGPLLTEDGRILAVASSCSQNFLPMGRRRRRSQLCTYVDLQAPDVRSWWVDLGLDIRETTGTAATAVEALGSPRGESAGGL